MSEGLEFPSKTVLEYRHIEWTFAVKHNLDFYDYFVLRTLIWKEYLSNWQLEIQFHVF